MKLRKLLMAALAACLILPATAAELRFAGKPTLAPDASQIYFTYDGNIWKVPVEGGIAMRVTSMTGYQTNPKVSPDGKWLAFSSNEQGNYDVYVTPTAGGPIRQLTFHDASDMVSSWSADSEWVYFESNCYNILTTYRVSIEGGTPERLFPDYFNTVVQLVEGPSGEYYFTESGEAFNYPTRKGYKGAHKPDILSWNPGTGQYGQVTDFHGKDIWPGVDRHGTLYWASDEKNGVYNLARYRDGKTEFLTKHKNPIHYPSVSYDGSKVVYLNDYAIHVYDVASGKTVAPPVAVNDNDRTRIENRYNVKDNVTDVALSPDGKKLAFVSRGLLFVSDKEGKYVRTIPTDPKERVVEVLWRDDNTLYYTRTREGWYNLYTTDASGKGVERALHTPDHYVKSLTLNSDRSQMAFITGSDRVEIMDTKSGRVRKLADGDFWSFHSYTLSFSPDDKYLAFSAMNLFERDIFVVDLKNGNKVNLTNSASLEDSPAWSPDGKYMYVVANRFRQSFPRGTTANLYRIALDRYDKAYKTDRFEELFAAKDTTKKSAPEISIDTHNIVRRWEKLVNGGFQRYVRVVTVGGKSYLLYGSNHEVTRPYTVKR